MRKRNAQLKSFIYDKSDTRKPHRIRTKLVNKQRQHILMFINRFIWKLTIPLILLLFMSQLIKVINDDVIWFSIMSGSTRQKPSNLSLTNVYKTFTRLLQVLMEKYKQTGLMENINEDAFMEKLPSTHMGYILLT